MAINIDDYIIDHSDVDWATVLREWVWLLPEQMTVWIMNRFGDLFLAIEDGSIQMLDVGAGTLERLADNREDFCNKIDAANNANDWLMIPLQLRANGVAKFSPRVVAAKARAWLPPVSLIKVVLWSRQWGPP